MMMCKRCYDSWLYQDNGTYSHVQKQDLGCLGIFPGKILCTHSSSDQQAGPECPVKLLSS